MKARLKKEFEKITKRKFWENKQKNTKKGLKKHYFKNRISNWWRKTKENRSLEGSFWRIILGRIISAFIIVIFLLVVDYIVFKLFNFNIINTTGFWKYFLIKDTELQNAILIAVMQVSAILIGLIFAAKGTILSAVYSRSPENVRTLITNEKPGVVYFEKLVHLAGFSFLFLIASLLGLYLGLFSFIYLGLAFIFGIYGFVRLSGMVYEYLDPTSLLYYPLHNFVLNFESVLPDKKGYDEENIQSSYQMKSEENLNTLHNLVSLMLNEREYDKTAINKTCEMVLSLLTSYTSHKTQIPSKSNWFKKTYEHKNWLTASQTEVRLALESGTPLTANSINDFYWVEDKISDIIVNMINKSLENEDYRSTIELIGLLQYSISYLSNYYCIDEGILVLKKISRLILNDTFVTSEALGDKLKLGVLEVFGLCYINFILGLAGRLSTVTLESISGKLESVDWNRQSTLYGGVQPREFTKQLEFLRKGIIFENEVEGEIISPVWYQQTIAIIGYFDYIYQVIPRIFNNFELIWISYKISLNNPIGYQYDAQHIQRGLEACSKLEVLLEECKSCLDRLNSGVLVEDLTLRSVEWDKYESKIEEYKSDLLFQTNNLLPNLANIARENDKPDYFGSAYSLIENGCLNAMFNKNMERFDSYFVNFFNSSLSAHDRLREELKDQSDKTIISFSSEPLFDLIDISGYAIIFTELGFGEFTKKVYLLWDKYLKSNNKIIAYLASLINYSISSLSFNQRSILRTEWKIKFDQLMEDTGLLYDPMYYRYVKPDEEPPQHNSPIIRSILSGRDVLYGPQEVFFGEFLMNQPGIEGIEFPYGIASYKESLDKEKERGGDDTREG